MAGRATFSTKRSRPARARDAASFQAADEDYFHDMDQDRNGPVALSREEIQGRNTWLVWTGGNDRLWEVLGAKSAGAVDFLKVVYVHPVTTVRPPEPLGVSRSRQRTVLRESQRAGSAALESLARHTEAGITTA